MRYIKFRGAECSGKPREWEKNFTGIKSPHGNSGTRSQHGFTPEFARLRPQFECKGKNARSPYLAAIIAVLPFGKPQPELLLVDAAERNPHDSPGDPPSSIMSTLRLKLPTGKQFLYKLNGRDEISIGRGDHNDVDVPDMSVSRRHAEFRLQGGEYAVRDLNSANGTFINGSLVEKSFLRLGDEIKFGAIEGFLEADGRTVLPKPAEYRSLPNLIATVCMAGCVAAVFFLLSNSVLPELTHLFGGGDSQTGISDPSTRYHNLKDKMAYLHNTIDALNSESGELNERGKELQSKKKTINSPLTNPVSDPGPEPYWLLHPFKNGSWKLRKEAFDNFQKLTAEASRTLASIESEVNQVNAAFESKRKEIEAKKKEIDHITPDFEGARAELNRQELFVRIKGFLSHIWKTYIAMPMHLLLCISLLTITLKFALRVALINGWLGICQIILHRNDYYHRIK